MPLRVLIVPDKFKGTLTAHQAATAIAAGWRKARPQDRLDLLPMSDGGDGFGEIVGKQLGARRRKLATINAAHRSVAAVWWLAAKQKIAIIESAKIIGLALLPAGKFHPFDLDTFGLAAALKAARRVGAQRILVGAGGSATNDAAFGMARGLGWRFFDKSGAELRHWWNLRQLSRIEKPRDSFGEVSVAVDVQNVLLGKEGCSRIYGPQKGLRPQDFAKAEESLARLALVLKRQLGLDYSNVPGAGAAGGLGFGLMAFAGAKIQSGFDAFLAAAGLFERAAASDLVITGEGKLDRQSHMGKGVGRVAGLSADLKIPCIALAGAFGDPLDGGRHLAKMAALTELTSAAEAMRRPAFFLRRLAFQTAQKLSSAPLARRA